MRPNFINHITSSPLSNTILPEGHHRPSSRDLTTRTSFTRKHPGHTQCLLTSHNHPSMTRVRKLAEEPWTPESWTHQQLSTAQLVQMIEEMVTLSNFVLNGVNYLRVQGPAMDTGMASPCATCSWLSYAEELAQLHNSKIEHMVEIHW